MRGLVLFATSISATAVWFAVGSDDAPAERAVVAAPRAAVYAQLDPLFAAIEAKATTVATVTGTPPIKVHYVFERTPGEVLGFTAKAGFRTVSLKVRLNDGPQPGTTGFAVSAEPASLLSSTGKPDTLSALTDVLSRAEPQFVEGARVKALFDSGLYDPNRPDRPYR